MKIYYDSKSTIELSTNCDSKSTIDLYNNPVFHDRSKYINIKYHFIYELVRDKEIEIDYCRTKK